MQLPPTIAFIYSLEAWKPITGLRRRGLMRTNKLLFISDHSRTKSHAANPWLASRPSEILHLGLLPEENTPQGTAAGESFVLSIGRISANEGYKGFEELIRVWPAIEKVRPGLRLVLIGDGDDRPRLERVAATANANVQFLGAVDDVTRDAYLRDCRCFCLPARGEGFGLVYLEAMRAGKAVLAGSTDAGREIVVDGVTGRTADPANSEGLVQAILDVSGGDSTSMGQAGRERYLRHFSYPRFLERFCGQIRELVG
jgi:glycosyltransferase involved in cell wall biosynthesis